MAIKRQKTLGVRKTKFHHGIFEPKNTEKYIGTTYPEYRSSWELTVMNMFDKHDDVIRWCSECINIPYYNPITEQWHVYIPDFIVTYLRDGETYTEVVEVKPRNQTIKEEANGRKNKLQLLVNQAKWEAAQEWCDNNGVQFRVITETEIYRKGRR